MSTFDLAMLITRVVFISAGLAGNALVFVVFSRAAFAKNSISTYSRALVLFDCFTLVQLAVDIGQLFGVILPFQSSAMCKLYYYSTLGYSTISGWILVVFSFDKLVGMRRSRMSSMLRRASVQWSLVAAVAVFNLALYVEVPILVDLEPYRPFPFILVCNLAYMRFYDVIIVLYLVESCLVPFVLMLVASVLIVRSIRTSRRRVMLPQGGGAGGGGGGISGVGGRRWRRDARFAISSITFNVLYVAFKIPLTVVNFFIIYGVQVSIYFDQTSVLLFFVNASASLLIHLASNSLFRRELLSLLHLSNGNDNNNNSNDSGRTQTSKSMSRKHTKPISSSNSNPIYQISSCVV